MALKLGPAEASSEAVSSAREKSRAETRRRSRRRRWRYRTLIGVGALLIVAAAAWQINATLWTIHSERVGHSLVEHFLKNRALTAPLKATPTPAGTASLAACNPAASASGAAQGLLVIPKLGLTAPVLEGTGDDQLNVAVGHLPSSVWPGTAGNAVFEAHDVSYFQNISQLVAGDEVEYESPCTTYVFHVQSHSVVKEGATVYDTAGPTLTMVTCWPTNALWFTPNRYVVSATEVSSSATGKSGRTYVAATPAPAVNIPPALAAQGVTLTTYSLPMGTMQVTGTPDRTWANTTDPLLVQSSGVQAYIAGVHALTENNPVWWNDLAPGGVPMPPVLVGADNPGYLSPLNVTIAAAGSTVTGITLSNTVSVTGGNAPGHYTVTVTEEDRKGILVITGWTMTPAA